MPLSSPRIVDSPLHVAPASGTPVVGPALVAGLNQVAALVSVPAEEADDQVSAVLTVAAALVPPTDGVSLTERRTGRRPHTSAASTVVAGEFDRLQFLVGEGPTVAALRDFHPVVVGDLTRDVRWPALREATTARSSVRSVLSLPVRAGRAAGSAVTFYAGAADAFDRAALEAAQLTLAALETALAGLEQRARASNLHRALMSNRRIGVAIGILMASRRCTEQQAFGALSDTSQILNRKLSEIADDVILTGTLPDLPERVAGV